MPGSGVRHILELALRRPDTIILAVGEPGEVVEPRGPRGRRRRRGATGDTRYTPNGGIPPLREAIVAKLARENDVHVDVEQVWVTVGATQALHMAMALTLSRRRRGARARPRLHDVHDERAPARRPCRCRTRCGPERGFQPDLAELEALVTDRTRAIIVNSPSNPLGSTFDRETLAALLDLARRHDLWVISDEVYERVHVGRAAREPRDARRRRPRALGLLDLEDLRDDRRARRLARDAARVAPDDAARAGGARQLRRRAGAARGARGASPGRRMPSARAAAHYRENLAAAMAQLDGARHPLSHADRRVLPLDRRLARSDGDVAAWCERFLDEAGVAVAPGTAFGASGEGWIRVCVASDRESLLEGLRRLPAPA